MTDQTVVLSAVPQEEIDTVIKALRRRSLQRSMANVIILVGAFALALCFPTMRALVSEYSLGEQLALTTENCSTSTASVTVQDYCWSAKRGEEPGSVAVSKAIVGSPLSTDAAPVVSQPPLIGTPVPGQPNVITVPQPDGTRSTVLIPPPAEVVAPGDENLADPAPQPTPTAGAVAPAPTQDSTAVAAPAPSPIVPDSSVETVPIQPAPGPTVPADPPSTAEPPPETTVPPETTQEPVEPPSTVTEEPAPSSDEPTVTTDAPTTTVEPSVTTEEPSVTTVEPAPVPTETPVAPVPTTEPSVLNQVLDSLFDSLV